MVGEAKQTRQKKFNEIKGTLVNFYCRMELLREDNFEFVIFKNQTSQSTNYK